MAATYLGVREEAGGVGFVWYIVTKGECDQRYLRCPTVRRRPRSRRAFPSSLLDQRSRRLRLAWARRVGRISGHDRSQDTPERRAGVYVGDP